MISGFIYLTTNNINGRKYVGKHIDNGKKYLGSGKLLKRAIKKYGKDNFTTTVLEECNNIDDLDKCELKWIHHFNAKHDETFYNLIDTITPVMYGVDNPFKGKKHSEESKSRMSKSHKGKILSEKHKKNIGIVSKNRWNDEEYKNKMKEKLLGHVVSEETRKKIGQANKGKVLSEETKQKISNSRMGISNGPVKEETKQKISESNKKVPHTWQDKINKNPDKIKKTAETHRGMKRSEESKRRMSEKAKNRPIHNKGKKYFYHPLTLDTILCLPENKPEGYLNGFVPRVK